MAFFGLPTPGFIRAMVARHSCLAPGAHAEISPGAGGSRGKEEFREHCFVSAADAASSMSYEKADKWLTQIQCRPESELIGHLVMYGHRWLDMHEHAVPANNFAGYLL